MNRCDFMSDDEFFEHLGHALYNMYGTETIPDTDHPDCPHCGTTMDFHGDDMHLDLGDEYWECPSCGFTFGYDCVRPYVVDNDEW